MAAGTGNKTRMEAALQKLRAALKDFQQRVPGSKASTELTAAQKRLLIETFGQDDAERIMNDWKVRGKAVGAKAKREPVSKALRDDLLRQIRSYNPAMKTKDLDWLLEHQGVEDVVQAINFSKKTLRDRAKLAGAASGAKSSPEVHPGHMDAAQIGYKSSNEDFWQPPVEPVIQSDKDGWYKADEFALGMKQQRERDAANATLEKELKAALGFTRDPFTGLEVPPKPQEKAVEMETNPFWRTTYPKQKAAAEPETKTHPFWRTKVRK